MTDRPDSKLLRVHSVLIVDDHPLYSDALCTVVRNLTGAKRVEITNTLRDTFALLTKRFVPSIVFFDLNLPDATGASGLISLHQKLSQVPIVVISATSNFDVIKLAENMGAAGYISKNLDREDLERAVGKILSGERYFPEAYVAEAKAVEGVDGERDFEDISQKLAQLTPQQTKILRMICEGKLNKQIAYELDLAEATVKTHITALMRKLGVQNRTQAALLVRDAVMAANLE